MATKPWSAYGIDQDSATAEEFKYVYHVAHLEDAIRIIEDGVIRASLVFDDSILKNTRTCVSWVSPNTWSPGSIYGNVAFAFRWKDIVKGKRIYWVEDPKTNRQQIVRLLLSEGKFSDYKLERYHAEKSRGPLVCNLDPKRWYFNAQLTNEYMVLQDLPLEKCRAINFWKHHDRYCSKEKVGCPYLGKSQKIVGARFLGLYLGGGRVNYTSRFSRVDNTEEIDESVDEAISHLYWGIISKFQRHSGARFNMEEGRAIIRSIFLAYGLKKKRLHTLVNMFHSEEALRTALKTEIGSVFKDFDIGICS
ncbi:MAG: hypothetical protein M5U26_10335 [Planctomycetota bacterium]|nr:hypothetical protein [Planctomycetota bacterium]